MIPKEHLPYIRIIISFIVLCFTIGFLMLILNYRKVWKFIKTLAKKGKVNTNTEENTEEHEY